MARPTSTSVIPWPTPEASSRAGIDGYACTATYCNRADTSWYALDKARLPGRREPHIYAEYPDAVGRARTCGSKLVAGAGKRFESARRLTLIGWNRQGAMATRAIMAEVRDPIPLGSTLTIAFAGKTAVHRNDIAANGRV